MPLLTGRVLTHPSRLRDAFSCFLTSSWHQSFAISRKAANTSHFHSCVSARYCHLGLVFGRVHGQPCAPVRNHIAVHEEVIIGAGGQRGVCGEGGRLCHGARGGQRIATHPLSGFRRSLPPPPLPPPLSFLPRCPGSMHQGATLHGREGRVSFLRAFLCLVTLAPCAGRKGLP
jgi:hypothetical protein